MIIDTNGYVARRTAKSGRKNNDLVHAFRNWWLVKWGTGDVGVIRLGCISVPKKYVGKKVRFKIEVIDE